MLEATLFGYEKGAFTGALAAHAGKFEQAQGGTLLLDEISEMDLGLQAKILRVLQEREVERLGSSRTISLDVRLIATSNRDLPEEVRAGALPRRSVLPAQRHVAAPAGRCASAAATSCPWRAAPSRHARAAARRRCALSPAAERKLLEHDWPGNARELTNIVQRAAWLASGGRIDARGPRHRRGARRPRRRRPRRPGRGRRKRDSTKTSRSASAS